MSNSSFYCVAQISKFSIARCDTKQTSKGGAFRAEPWNLV
jgi:hypothetical protein